MSTLRALALPGALILAATGCDLDTLVNGPSRDSREARAAFEAYVLDFWSVGDVSALGRALGPDMVYHYNGMTVPGDPASHLSYLESFGGAFTDVSVSIDAFTFDGSLGAAATSWSGTHSATLCGAEPTGESLGWAVNYVFRLEGGLIAELWETWDEGSLFLSIGASALDC